MTAQRIMSDLWAEVARLITQTFLITVRVVHKRFPIEEPSLTIVKSGDGYKNKGHRKYAVPYKTFLCCQCLSVLTLQSTIA